MDESMSRQRYHHGDLRNALIAAGSRLAEQGGREAVGVRSAARAVGVTPTAAYRHFANAEELRDAVRERALEALAASMDAELAKVEPSSDAVAEAIAQLMAVGRGYLNFAFTETGLFRTAFGEWGASLPTHFELPVGGGFETLSAALDNLVAVGYLPADRRPLAEFAAWSTVHGLARLVVDGPLATLSDDDREAVAERAFEMVVRGL